MNRNDLLFLAKLRILVGYLGERNQYGWWQSSFFGVSSQPFLRPVFVKTTLLAQYYGVKEAATRVHDEHIGVGRGVFHLFRLPERYEQELHTIICEEELNQHFSKMITDKETACQMLGQYAKSDVEILSGPVRVGGLEDLERKEVWETVAQYYKRAFEADNQIFPFFSEK